VPTAPLVLVVVIAVGGMTVPVVLIVNMVAVSDRVVPAAWPVSVPMAGVSQMGQGMLVVVAEVFCVGMALMNVIDMALALHTRVPAAGPVLVVVVEVNFMPGGCHGSSLLW
jgi:hypothetical protein